jgi:aryl-alcohol dehydrogenase-like predicted oxidoreductase
VSVQDLYNLTDHRSEAIIQYCQAQILCFFALFPITSGKQARPARRLGKVARCKRTTPAQVALAWLLKRSSVLLPILGPASVAHLDENDAAASPQLTEAEEFADLEWMGRLLAYLRKGRDLCHSLPRAFSPRR